MLKETCADLTYADMKWCVACECMQANKITLHRDHKWDIFGMWLEDPEVRAEGG